MHVYNYKFPHAIAICICNSMDCSIVLELIVRVMQEGNSVVIVVIVRG